MRVRTLLVSLLLPASVAAQQDGGALPLETLLEIGSVVGEVPRWSPDGTRILYVSGGGLVTVGAEGGFPRRLPVRLAGAGHFLATSNPVWSPDGKRVAYISDKSGLPEIWLWSAEDGSERQLTAHGARINAFSWSPDGRWIAFSGDRFGGYDVWKIPASGGEATRLTRDERYEGFPTWTPDGGRILFVRLDGSWVDHDVIEITADGERPRVVVQDADFFDYGAGGKFGEPDVSPDGRLVLFPSYRSGWINYWVVPLAGGEPRAIAPAAADQTEARWSPDGRSIAYVENHDGKHELRVVEVAGGAPRVLVDPGVGVVSAPDWSPDGGRLSFALETPTRPRDLFVVSARGGEPRQLTFSLPEGELEGRLVRPEKVRYRSSDGLTISAYLYRPPAARPGERFPAIVWTHGGPTSQYNDTFDQNAQFFAQRGYVVLLPNIRGSSGYGRAFEDANNRCWGHCDLEDVAAGVEYLKSLPFVDGGRLGTTGSSYGGFMTCAALTFAPDLFQAAVAASGYCNRVSFVDEGEFRHVQQLAYEFGPFEQNREVYQRNSPYFFVKRIRTPTFVVHGEGRYPGSEQMKEFAAALQREYKPFRYKAYPNENYYVRGKENRRELYGDMLNFFDYYLKGRQVPLAGVASLEELARR